MDHGPYAAGLDRNQANYAPLTPSSLLAKAAEHHPDRTAIVHGERRLSWAEVHDRCRRLASALVGRGIRPGETVSVMAPNTPAMVEAHFGVPMARAVLNTLNIRLDAEAIAFQLAHGESRLVLCDREFAPTIARALRFVDPGHRPVVVDIDDPAVAVSGHEPIGETEYEAFLAGGDPRFLWTPPADEWDAIALNYTSGTTGNPRGVVYHHRGAYLNALNNVLTWGMPHGAVYLWTLPMFHCNGWCFPWTMAAVAGTNVCLRRVEPAAVFAAFGAHGVTHMAGAPIVYNMLIAARTGRPQGGGRVQGLVAGAAPPAATIEGAERIGIDLTHVYGLTETYGPAAVCTKHAEWQGLPVGERARLNARQGKASLLQEAMSVRDPQTLAEVPADGATIGEVMFRGNITMKGYLKNPTATAESFAGGWFRTGDLAVVEPDGYVRIRDRAKDVIISGGENISSLEVEDVLHRHPDVLAAAVVAKPDPTWGEVPCAFVELAPGARVTEADLRAFCRTALAGYKMPKRFVFGPVPKTSTGKIQKFVLRERAREI